jgi:hypothetical protein
MPVNTGQPQRKDGVLKMKFLTQCCLRMSWRRNKTTKPRRRKSKDSQMKVNYVYKEINTWK